MWPVSLYGASYSFKIGLDVLACRSKLPVYSQRRNKTTKKPITELLNIAKRKKM